VSLRVGLRGRVRRRIERRAVYTGTGTEQRPVADADVVARAGADDRRMSDLSER
jgi:hypothetical protein